MTKKFAFNLSFLSHSFCKLFGILNNDGEKKGTTIRLITRKGINIQSGILDLYRNLDQALWKDRYIIKIDNYVIFPEFSNYIDNLFSCD